MVELVYIVIELVFIRDFSRPFPPDLGKFGQEPQASGDHHHTGACL
jgi:hypothetical protein